MCTKYKNNESFIVYLKKKPYICCIGRRKNNIDKVTITVRKNITYLLPIIYHRIKFNDYNGP